MLYFAPIFDVYLHIDYVQAAVPCLEMERQKADKGHTDVEMNYVSVCEAKIGLERLGMQVGDVLHSQCLVYGALQIPETVSIAKFLRYF